MLADGRQRGYRVYPGPNQAAFNRLGLRPGDLVTAINGTTLDDPTKGGEIFSTLSSVAEARVTVIRNGSQQELVLNLAEVANEADRMNAQAPPARPFAGHPAEPGGDAVRPTMRQAVRLASPGRAGLCGHATVAAGGAARQRITLNFRDTDIATVTESVATATGKTFIIDPRVRAQVNLISSTPMTAEEFYQAFLSMLQVHGFAAVPSGNVIKIVHAERCPDGARQRPADCRVSRRGRDGDAGGHGEEHQCGAAGAGAAAADGAVRQHRCRSPAPTR